MMQTEWRHESLELAQEIRRHAEARGMTAGQFAVLWCSTIGLVTSTIAGPRTEAQWDDYLAPSRMTSLPRTRRWSIGWSPPAIPRRPAITTPLSIEGRVPHVGAAPR